MLDRHSARRWTHASQGALAVLLVTGALAVSRDLRVVAQAPAPPATEDPEADPGYQPPVVPVIDVAIVSEGLSRPKPPPTETADPPSDTTPDEPDPGDVADGGSDELRYLGAVVGGGKRMALVAMGDRQKLVIEGREFEGVEIVSATPDRLLVRDDSGEREIAKSRRTGSRFTDVTVKGGGDSSSIGARELSRRGGGGDGLRDDVRRRLQDLQRAAIRDNQIQEDEVVGALDAEARAALDKAEMDHAAAEARRAATAKRKAQPPRPAPSPGEQGP